eukprot:CAMPEP_0206016888 /NCGR_PEP_ID=MMETSP1464-20131121/23809_1 /ASSEMBLY_ACC=CAM_ASM_001124 /TAXON_ID=119497 /ORGANISM="Exanthemachrysis gayraliae, Strain RCC1523" /LENGTH=787 /DNA_ID=CAMNT_0053390719 /DNA_START=11 /DNA_END=2374 /DNA_ORIENTATION=+
MGAANAYLVAYNLACMVGWAYALFLAFDCLLATQGDLTKVWAAAYRPMQAAQWAMCLEVVHAVLGLVRSPFLTVFLQVLSRIMALLVATTAPPVQASWPCGLMLISWALVEVPRYAFYLNALLAPKGTEGTLYPVFWLRYSLFAILYPTGITGEVLTMYKARSTAELAAALPNGLAVTLVSLALLMYLPGSPFMYMNMVKNRKSAFKKRYPPPEKPKAPERGTLFPADGKGGRSTSVAGKAVIAAALKGAGEAGAAASDKCMREKNWRFNYHKHYMTLVRLGCSSPAAALGTAKAGLDWVYSNFEFVTADGKKGPFKQVVDGVKGSFKTGMVAGTKAKSKLSYKVPYNGGWHPTSPKPPPPGAVLEGASLKSQATKWADKGVVEPDAAQALAWTADYFDSGKTLEGVYFVMVGAGSAMGPFPKLLELGATVVAIDIPGSWGKGGPRPTKGLWKRLCDTARASPGNLVFPMSKDQSACADDDEMYEASGCDLMNQPGEIANWLVDWQKTLPSGAQVVIGNYTYLDGDLHVKLALCADYCIQRLCAARPSTAVAFLCTPTDIHVCTDAANAAARKAYGAGLGSLGMEMLFHLLSGGKCLVKNALSPVKTDKKVIQLVDGLSVAQGPNYALAKRMQHWRACLAFEGGHTVSSMVAPSTATLSVIHNRSFAWAYGGMPYFGYEIFKQETTNAVMAALLMHDALNPKSSKNPKNRNEHGIDNTLELFRTQAVHGGLWRCAYKVDSIGEASALIYFAGLAAPAVAAASAIGVALAGAYSLIADKGGKAPPASE